MSRNKFNRREMLKRLGLATAATVVAACVPPATEETGVAEEEKQEEVKSAPAPSEKVTLRLVRVGGSLGEHTPAVVEMFMDANPDIEVQMEDIAYGDIWTKTELGFASGDWQDVVHSFTRYFFLGAYQGLYLQLDELLETTDAVPDYDDYYEIAVENVKFEGKTFALVDSAYTGPTTHLTWNRSLIDEAGVEPPNPDMNMQDLFDLAMKCTNTEEGIFGIEMNHNTHGRLCNTLRTYGKPEYGVDGDTSSWLVSPDGKQFRLLDNWAAEEYFTNWYGPLVTAGAQPPEFETGIFQAGKAAMFQGHHGNMRQLEKRSEWDWNPEDTMLMPVGVQGRRGTSQESQLKCINPQTKHPMESLRLAAFLTGPDSGRMGLETHGGYSARKSVYDDPTLWETYPFYKDHHELMLSGIVEPYPMPWNFRDPEVLDAHRNLFAPLYAGTESFEELASTIQEEIQKIFDQPRP